MQKSRKIVVLGHFGVGKTSLIRRFVENSFSDNYKVTIGVHITKKVVEIDVDKSISLIIWDLEGTDEIQTVRESYLLGTHGVVYVFDVSRPSTFEGLQDDLSIIGTKVPNTTVLVVGNKVDLVAPGSLKELLEENAIRADYLTSAKTGDAVEEMFVHLATLINGHA